MRIVTGTQQITHKHFTLLADAKKRDKALTVVPTIVQLVPLAGTQLGTVLLLFTLSPRD